MERGGYMSESMVRLEKALNAQITSLKTEFASEGACGISVAN